MKKYVDGKYLDMTPDEIAEMKSRLPEIPQQTDDNKRWEKVRQEVDKNYVISWVSPLIEGGE